MLSNFWNWWVILLFLACNIFIIALLFGTRKTQRPSVTEETTGHIYDGIQEYDNPLPHWWFMLFVATIVFSAGYLALYPGLGNFPGLLGWTSLGELKSDQKAHSFKYAPEFERFAAIPVEDLINNPKALRMGQRIFLNNCALCHGSDAGGAFGFPNLSDHEWLYGASGDNIKTSVSEGRQGQMPAWGAIIGDKGVQQVSSYIRSEAGLETSADPADLKVGKQVYAATCAVCHNVDGTGNQALGAPNLFDSIWLYGSSRTQVEYTIRNGRNGVMPPWKDILGAEKTHLVSAYVYSLSNKNK